MSTAAIATCSSTLASAISACATMWALVSERPLVCVASPTHFDHIGCHHELGERCVHFAEAAILADPRKRMDPADRYATDEMFDRFPEAGQPSATGSGWCPPSVPSPIATWSFSAISVSRSTRPDTRRPLSACSSKRRVASSPVYDGPLIDDAYHSDPDAYVAVLETLRRLPISIVHG